MNNTNLAKQLETYINNATNETKKGSNTQEFIEICNILNSKADIPKIAVGILKKRLLTKNPKVQELVLELIEAASNSCELPFLNHIATKDFIVTLDLAIKDKNVIDHLKRLLVFCVTAFQESKDFLPLLFHYYENVSKKHGSMPEPFESKYSYLRKPKEIPKELIEQEEKQKKKTSMNNNKGEGQSTWAKIDYKIKCDLYLIKQNVDVANDIIDECEPGDPDAIRRNEVLYELMYILKEAEAKLRNLMGTLSSGAVLTYCLEVHDDIAKTFERYSILLTGIRPQAFLNINTSLITENPELVEEAKTQQNLKPRRMNIEDLFTLEFESQYVDPVPTKPAYIEQQSPMEKQEKESRKSFENFTSQEQISSNPFASYTSQSTKPYSTYTIDSFPFDEKPSPATNITSNTTNVFTLNTNTNINPNTSTNITQRQSSIVTITSSESASGISGQTIKSKKIFTKDIVSDKTLPKLADHLDLLFSKQQSTNPTSNSYTGGNNGNGSGGGSNGSTGMAQKPSFDQGFNFGFGDNPFAGGNTTTRAGITGTGANIGSNPFASTSAGDPFRNANNPFASSNPFNSQGQANLMQGKPTSVQGRPMTMPAAQGKPIPMPTVQDKPKFDDFGFGDFGMKSHTKQHPQQGPFDMGFMDFGSFGAPTTKPVQSQQQQWGPSMVNFSDFSFNAFNVPNPGPGTSNSSGPSGISSASGGGGPSDASKRLGSNTQVDLLMFSGFGSSSMQLNSNLITPQPIQSRPSMVNREGGDARSLGAEIRPREAETRPRETEIRLREAETRPRGAETKPRETETRPREIDTRPHEAETRPCKAEISSSTTISPPIDLTSSLTLNPKSNSLPIIPNANPFMMLDFANDTKNQPESEEDHVEKLVKNQFSRLDLEMDVKPVKKSVIEEHLFVKYGMNQSEPKLFGPDSFVKIEKNLMMKVNQGEDKGKVNVDEVKKEKGIMDFPDFEVVDQGDDADADADIDAGDLDFNKYLQFNDNDKQNQGSNPFDDNEEDNEAKPGVELTESTINMMKMVMMGKDQGQGHGQGQGRGQGLDAGEVDEAKKGKEIESNVIMAKASDELEIQKVKEDKISLLQEDEQAYEDEGDDSATAAGDNGKIEAQIIVNVQMQNEIKIESKGGEIKLASKNSIESEGKKVITMEEKKGKGGEEKKGKNEDKGMNIGASESFNLKFD